MPFLAIDHELTRAETTFTFTSATKGWNIAGLKCGLAVAGCPGRHHAAGTAVGGAAGEPPRRARPRWPRSPRGCRGWTPCSAQLDENRTLLSGLLAEHLPGVGYAPPQASFLAWLDCRDLGLGDDPAAVFLEKGSVALGRGPDFGTEGHGFARLNMGTSPELLEEVVRRMASAL